MDRERLLKWLDQIYATQEVEFDCERLQSLLPTWVELEAGGQAALDDERLNQIRAHLAQCPDCAEEYEGLRAIVLLDSQGRLPTVEESLVEIETATTFEHA